MFADKLALGLSGLGVVASAVDPTSGALLMPLPSISVPAGGVSPVGPAWAIDPAYLAYLSGSPGATPVPLNLTDSTSDSSAPPPLTPDEVMQAQINNQATSNLTTSTTATAPDCTDSIGCFTIGSTQIPETPLLLVAGLLLIYTFMNGANTGGRRR